MPLMTNAEAFLYDFGLYATELWAMTEAQFLEWLNAECDRERPIDAVPAWIPVTERLPEPYSGEYLVTINDGSVYTDILWFDSPGDGRYESCFYKTDDDGYGVVCDDVIAWMPLPEPYKGERKTDEQVSRAENP